MSTRTAEWFPIEAPPLYSTEEVAAGEKLVVAKYSLLSSEWFIVEYDSETMLAFGYAVLNGDTDNSEWGYISLKELFELVLELEQNFNGMTFHHRVRVERVNPWQPTPAKAVEGIQIRS